MHPQHEEVRMLVARRANLPVRIDAKRRAPHVAARSLMRDEVYDDAGRRVGEIDEIILDVHTGCVRYVVVSSGGFLGIGRNRFAVPWRALTPDLDYHRCVLDAARMSLMAIPVVDDDPWLAERADARENPIPLRRLSSAATTATAANDE
jgi:sporulation protein YlmC with PRC-barrel domain